MKKNIQAVLISILFIFISGTLCFAQDKNTGSYSGVITADSVNLRSGPGVNFEILRKLDKGNTVLVLEADNEWLKLSLPRNSNAFIHKDFIKAENSIFGVITGKRVNIRAGEGTNFNIIGQLNTEDQVEIIRKGTDWFHIYPYENCFAWVHKDFVKKSGAAKDYVDNEIKKREGLKLLIEAETFEKTSKQAAINSKDLSPIIQRYKVIIRDYAQSPANESARSHIERLAKITLQIKQTEAQDKAALETPRAKKGALSQQPNSSPDAQGKIIEAGRFFNRPGTHRLTKNGKTIYFLKSDKLNINDYTYHLVQVWGKIISKKSKIPVIEVDFIKKLN